MGSRFQTVQQGPPIEVFQLNRMFMEDPHQSKINLSIGGEFCYYFTNSWSRKTYVFGFPAVPAICFL